MLKMLNAKYPTVDEFLSSYQSMLLNGGVFIPTRFKHERGSPVLVEVRFPGLKSKVLIQGKVAWRRAGKRSASLRAGVGIEFLPTERRKRDYLLGVAQGTIVDRARRRHRRLPVQLNVDWREKSTNTWYSSLTEDISEGGLFIRSDHLLSPGSSLVMELLAPGGQRKISVEGVVARISNDESERGMGIEFRARDMGGARLLREIVRRIESKWTAWKPKRRRSAEWRPPD